MTSRHYLGMGKCLVCLESSVDLTREHIINLGLSSDGEIYINNATCAACNRRMNEVFENPAMQSDYLEVRAILGLKRRKKRKKLRLPKISVMDDHTGIWHELDIPIEKRPGTIAFIELPPAGLLAKVDRRPGLASVAMRLKNLFPERAYRNMSSNLPFVEGAAPRLIAKAGYMYGVAEFGLEAFDGREIRDLLMDKREDIYNFIGGISQPERLDADELHRFYIRRRGDLLTVIVHLFASIDAPAYEVVLGRATP